MIYLGVLLFFTGQTLGWFQLNLQSVSEYWKDKALLSAVLMGVPTSVMFWYGWKFVVEATDSAWSARFLASCTGLIIFPILTWYLLGESMFTPKTLICLSLTIIIMIIQIFCWHLKEGAKAAFSDGVLSVRAPQRPEKKPVSTSVE